jgi:PKD repeat protein
VSLQATSAQGSSVNYKGQYITVISPAFTANFQASVTKGPAPLKVRFTATANATVSSYSWKFGDGTSSTAANPEHIYQQPGTYSVSLTLTGPGGSDSETKTGLITVEEEPETHPLQVEAGETQVNHQWTTIALTKSFQSPVVLVNPLSLKGGDPAVVQVKDVTDHSFAMRVHEWSYLDGVHVAETVGYTVVEAGSHQLPDGSWLEAGTIELDSTKPVYPVGFTQAFIGSPVVMSTVASNNDPRGTAVTTRIKNVTANGFEIRLQKEEGQPKVHAMETINYLAWQPSSGEVDGYAYQVGSTANVVTDKPYQIKFAIPFATAPVFLADMQTMNGGDPANLRWSSKTGSDATILIDEESSADAETTHVKEVVGFLLLRDSSVQAPSGSQSTDKPADASAVVNFEFDEGVGSLLAIDAGSRGNDGVLVGGPTYEAGSVDGSAYALRFDGVDDNVYVGAVDISGNALTLAAWFNADNFPGDFRDPRIISKATSSADADHIFMLSTIKVDTETRLRARIRTNGVTTTLIATAGNLSTGKWHHAAATYDGSVVRLYLDGVQVGNTPLSGTVANDPGIPVIVGGLPAINSRYFDGLIDGVKILERAMSASEIGELAVGGQD